jgi:hypothetical protein
MVILLEGQNDRMSYINPPTSHRFAVLTKLIYLGTPAERFTSDSKAKN